jgi:hypothetical protein
MRQKNKKSIPLLNQEHFSGKKEKKKPRHPIGIYIISIIYLLGSIPTTILAIVLFINPGIINQIPPFNQSQTTYSGVLTVFSVLMLILALLFIIASIGLLKRKNWARIGIVSFNLINIIGGVWSVLEKNYLSIINIVFNSIVLLYLIFSRKVKKEFSQKIPENEKSSDSFSVQQPGDLLDDK